MTTEERTSGPITVELIPRPGGVAIRFTVQAQPPLFDRLQAALRRLARRPGTLQASEIFEFPLDARQAVHFASRMYQMAQHAAATTAAPPADARPS